MPLAKAARMGVVFKFDPNTLHSCLPPCSRACCNPSLPRLQGRSRYDRRQGIESVTFSLLDNFRRQFRLPRGEHIFDQTIDDFRHGTSESTFEIGVLEYWSTGVLQQEPNTPLLQIVTLQFFVSLRHIAHQEQVIDIIHSAQLYALVITTFFTCVASWRETPTKSPPSQGGD